ncbi:MAG: hypothetical protein AMXMBFR7_38660 [Planctomycetota bacterium]
MHTTPVLTSLDRLTLSVIPKIRQATQGKRMVALVKQLVATERWNRFDRWQSTTRTLVRAYRDAGAHAEVYRAPTGGALGSGRWIVAEASDVHTLRAEIVAPFRRPLLDAQENPWHAVQWTAGTAAEGLTGTLVVEDDLEELKHRPADRLRGRFVLTRLEPRVTRTLLFDKGVLGVVYDCPVKDLPGATGWLKFGWGSLPYGEASARLVGMALSQRAGERLRAELAKHKAVRLRVKADVRRYAGTHDVVSGVVRGAADPQDEVWAVAHSSEPGALDNASGVAVCVEIARVLEALIAKGALPRPKRSIRFLSGYECYGFFHYLEHARRLQPPLAGVCIDTVGAKPELCEQHLRWHATVPGSADFVDELGSRCLEAASTIDSAGYVLERRPFVSTEDTLLGDPQFGFPCPWLTNHPFRGYHSDADTPKLLHAPGLALSAAAMAGYLYYLADAATPEALEMAESVTSRTLAALAEPGLSPALAHLRREAHRTNLNRLRRWWWGGRKSDLEARFAAAAARVAAAGPRAEPSAAKSSPVVRRTAPLAPAAENTPPELWQRIAQSGLSKWALYWADGNRTLEEIRQLIGAGRKQALEAQAVLDYFRALEQLGYVRLSQPRGQASRAQLVRDLKRLGVKPGMDLMVHSSLSKVGPVAGGVETVIDALLEAIGARGTLLMPSFNHFAARVYNPLTTPTTNGALPDAFWRRTEAVRSLQGTHAVAALGPKAEWFCAGHLEHGIWAAKSPIGRLVHHGGYILGLGVDNTSSTAYHIGEISLGCGCLDMFGSRDWVVTESGEAMEAGGLAWRAGGCPVSPRKLDSDLDAAGLQRHGKVGQADCMLVKAHDVWATRRKQLEKICPGCSVKPHRRRGGLYAEIHPV